MSSQLDQLRSELNQLSTQLGPLEDQLKALRKEANARVKSVRKYMETNKLTELELAGVRYTLEEETDTKCTINRMRATLPEDVVEEYIQANTLTEMKFRKTKIPPSE